MLSEVDAWDRLIREIQAGRCVAFVGAGFSAPVCRRWGELLEAVAGEVGDAGVGEEVRALVKRGAGNDLEVAAQILEDAFAGAATSRLLEVVRTHTPKKTITPEEAAQMKRRRDLLLDIPFASILTTNFDDVLPGSVLDGETYGSLMRDVDQRWLESKFWMRRNEPARQTAVLKLHGDLRGDKGITLSRRGYRTRLYAEPGYLNVLRTVFLTKTILFIGFSFNDAYLNELRSEALAYLGKESATPTLAFALLPDAQLATQAHYARHEGIHVFSYSSNGGGDHTFVDDFLEKVHEKTNPTRVIGPRLKGKHILWVDRNPQHNVRGHAFLESAAHGLCKSDLVLTPEEALERLQAPDAKYDLVITRWGHHHKRDADAVVLLKAMRREGVEVPSVVFASGDFGDENRERALRLGALEYTSHWETLFEVIDRRFGPRPRVTVRQPRS